MKRWLLALFVAAGCASGAAAGSGSTVADGTQAVRPAARVLVVGAPASADVVAAVAGDLGGTVAPAREDDAQTAASGSITAALTQAREHAMRWEMDAAIALLVATKDQLVARAASRADVADLHAVLATLALVESDRDRAAASDDYLRQAAAIAPDRALDPSSYPPDLVERHRVFAGEQGLAAPAAKPVVSVPTGAAVHLDGALVGRTPVTVRASPGTHHLRIVAPGRDPYAALVPWETDPASHRVTLTLRARSAAIYDLASDPDRVASLARAERATLARHVGAETMIVLDGEDDAIGVVALDLVRGRVGRRTLRWPEERAQIAALVEGLDPIGGAPPEAHDDDGSIWESPWLWGAIVVGLAGAGVGIALVASDEPDPVFRLTQE